MDWVAPAASFNLSLKPSMFRTPVPTSVYSDAPSLQHTNEVHLTSFISVTTSDNRWYAFIDRQFEHFGVDHNSASSGVAL